MELLFTILGGVLASGAVFGLKKLGASLFLSKYGKVIEKTFAVLDPIAGELIKSYEGSSVQEAIEFAVLRVADSEIDEKDAIAVAQYVVSKFSPQIAATKVLDAATPEGQATLEIADAVKSMTDGVDRNDIRKFLRSATALI